MRTIYSFRTQRGTARIIYDSGKHRFHAVFGDESLGSYHAPEQAAEDLAGGHTLSHSSGIDLSTLGIPEELGEWQRAS